MGKADGRPAHHFSTRVGGHNQNDIAEIRFAPIVIGQTTVIHNLQQ